MITFDEARARILSGVQAVGLERVTVSAAAGRVLRAPLHAPCPLPRFDHSAMDGYAIAVADLAGVGPFSLRVEGESAAGTVPKHLLQGAASRIFTGAPIPPRADAVIMQEHVEREGDRITFASRPREGAHIRRAGEDMAGGALAIDAGARLGPGHLALAAMLGLAEIVVARRPQVVIVCTGNELRAPGEAGGPSSIPESNSAPIGALARQAGADVHVAPIANDDPEATARALVDALRACDLLLTIGGVSVGDHDVVRPALERAGVTLDFWKVAIKPGKPLAVGRSGAARVLGLPGNPSSAMVTFAVFGVPLLRAMQGDTRPLAPRLRAKLAVPHKRSPDRLELARVTLDLDGDILARPHGNQASGAATSLAASDGIAIIPPGTEPLAAGDTIDVMRWGDL